MRGIAFDIETADADLLHSYGPGFIRLCGWQDIVDGEPTGPVNITQDPEIMARELLAADFVTGHNCVNFDIMAFAAQRYLTLDEYEAVCRKSFDTLIVERHVDPVAARGVHPKDYYTLDTVAMRYGAGRKSVVDFEGKREIARRVVGDKRADRMKRGTTDEFSVLKVLADYYGGFDQIPVDDEDYVRYLVMDVEAQGRVYAAQRKRLNEHSDESRRYVREEHMTTATLGCTTLTGAAVDTGLVMREWQAGQDRIEVGKELLHKKYGMPAEGAKPHVTNLGKAAFRRAVLATGISDSALDANWPKAKDGSLRTGKDVLNGFIPIFEKTVPEAAELCKVILAMNGERSIYGTFMDNIVGDRIHPYIGPDQSSGRWSMRKPGVTVVKKTGPERAMVLPDPGDLLLAVDADQADARIVAALSGDTEYAKLLEPGYDLHSEVAWRVFQDPKCRAEMDRNDGRCECPLRKAAKIAGFSWNYGGGIGTIMALGVPEAQARAFDAGMRRAFPVLCEWKDLVREEAGALPYGEPAPVGDTFRILHTWAGRPVRVERERAYTQAPALLGQGGTRDLMATALRRLPHGMRRRIRAVVHDEFLFSVPSTWTTADSMRLTDDMRVTINQIDFTFGASKLGRNWAECYA